MLAVSSGKVGTEPKSRDGCGITKGVGLLWINQSKNHNENYETYNSDITKDVLTVFTTIDYGSFYEELNNGLHTVLLFKHYYFF